MSGTPFTCTLRSHTLRLVMVPGDLMVPGDRVAKA